MNNFKKHIESSKLARETNSILEKYFAKEDIASFIEKIKPYLTDLQDLKPKSNGSSHDQVFFSDKLRLISDRLVTLAERKLEGTKYFEFLLEFGKLLITEGENELAFEMFELILNNTVPDPNTDSLRGYSLLGLADVYSRQARWKESVSNIRKARTIFEKSYDSHGLGKCEFYMGSILVEKGDLDAAKVRFEHSLTYLIPEKDKMLVGMIEVNLGIIQFIEGDLDSAHKHYVSGLQIFEELEKESW